MMINFIKGILIGVANIIPGVSGGTFALILGIYNRLINALGNFDKEFFKSILHPSGLIEEVKKRDGSFLFQIIVGAGAAIAVLSWIIDYLLKNSPDFTLSFFIGLIIPSIAIPYNMIGKKNVTNLVFIIPGILIILGVYFFRITSDIAITLPFIFISGVIAISAMVLPGISGSFVLLVMGVYERIIVSVKFFTSSLDLKAFIILVTFGLGCILGLMIFVRIMKYLFLKYRDKTLFLMIGLVLGSLVILWPFKDYPDLKQKENIEISISQSKNIIPKKGPVIFYNILFFIAGLGFSTGLNYLAKKDNN